MWPSGLYIIIYLEKCKFLWYKCYIQADNQAWVTIHQPVQVEALDIFYRQLRYVIQLWGAAHASSNHVIPMFFNQKLFLALGLTTVNQLCKYLD